jgi:hypothetical protein
VDGVIPKRDIGDGEIERFVGKFGFFKRLLADVGAGIQRFGDFRGQGINLNAGDGRTAEHCVRHKADENRNEINPADPTDCGSCVKRI